MARRKQRRFFNTAGPCRPELHYTVDSLPRLHGVEELIDHEQYFILHAPRQTGKTTYLYALMHKLNREGRYSALQVNIQAAASGRDVDQAMQIVAGALFRASERHLPVEEQPDDPGPVPAFSAAGSLEGYLTRWTRNNPKPIVLFIDEADSLFDDLFLALLRQLRAGFEARPEAFPQSVALVGLRDVRDYKIRIRPENASLGTGSPFNIKSKSFFMMGFTRQEVDSLLDQHTEETGQEFSLPVRDEIWRLCQGQPWLTNALSHQIVAEVLHNDFSQEITLEHVIRAREALIQQRDTHLDSLVDKLREPQIALVVRAIINGKMTDYDTFDDAAVYAHDLGLITKGNPVRFANPIYQEIVPRVMAAGFERGIPTDFTDQSWYITEGCLDMDALLKSFQEFYRENSEAWLEKYDFREVGRQLLLMAFLQRILNSGGRIEREMAVGNGRCDLVVFYGPDRFVLELKIKRTATDRDRGIKQLLRYLDRLGRSQGYLLLFENDDTLPWEQRLQWETIEEQGKRITLVGM